MSTRHTMTLGIVLLAGLYFVALATVSLVAPRHAARFLMGFAGSARAHYLELALRAVVGGALVLHAPRMRLAAAFGVFGWMLLLTTAGLVAVPWRWHRAFAQQAVPRALRHLPIVGAASLVLGGAILAAALTGAAT